MARPYPVNLLLEGRPVLVVGGGPVAAAKVRGLLDAGAEVHVVALAVAPEVRALTPHWEERPYRRGDVAGYRYVVACTDDPSVNQAVFDDGEAAGIFVNAADDPRRCSVTLPARLERGDVLVTVSTGGRSPALAAWLRDRLARELGPEVAELLDLLADERQRLAAAGVAAPPAIWRAALDSGMLELVRDGRSTDARARLRAMLEGAGAPPPGSH